MPGADPCRHQRNSEPCLGLIPAGIEEQASLKTVILRKTLHAIQNLLKIQQIKKQTTYVVNL